jgi:hypothetical protein
MLINWKGWVIIVTLILTGYVQNVGAQVERLSGLQRVNNLGMYRYLFGGPPWVAWPMFRYGGVICTAGVVVTVVLFGWIAAGVTLVAILSSPFIFWHVSRIHARGMLEDVNASLRRDQKPEPHKNA